MKKVLFSSAVLAALLAGSAIADVPASALNVGLSGYTDFQAGFRDQKAAYRNPSVTKNQKNRAFSNVSRVSLKASAQSNNGLMYGGVVGLKVNGQADSDRLSNQLDKTYVFVEADNMGRFELGSNYSAARTMSIDAATVARATGGASDGDWSMYVNDNGTSFVKPNHLTDHFASSKSEEIRKITYYSPRYYNMVQFGLSYAPDTANSGVSDLRTGENNSPRDFKNVFSGGLTLSQQFDQMTVALALTGEMGESKFNPSMDTRDNHDLKSYALGGSMNYANFALSGSMGRIDKRSVSEDRVAGHKKAVKFWTLGGAYVQGPVGTSLTYYSRDWQGNKLEVTSLGVDYALAPGFTSYAEVSMFNQKSNMANVTKNKGNVLMLGTQVNF